MKFLAALSLLLLLTVSFIAGYFFPAHPSSSEHSSSNTVYDVSDKPDFSSYTDVKQKKLDFFLFLLPKVQAANGAILKERQWLTTLNNQQPPFNASQTNTLQSLIAKYKIKSNELDAAISQLLIRVDIIPASLVLAQAANESAWATSRFAVQGNNLFGQWCYVKDCGLVPKKRGKGQHHEVAQFKTVQQSVESYMRNLNSQYSYEDLRQLRHTLRNNNEVVSGHTLAQGLIKYSTRREAYVKEIQLMIRQNGLSQYD